tara:strand:- start:274 stop:444 length:171 start_codon:yes stop_codon:yes gene_type:complete
MKQKLNVLEILMIGFIFINYYLAVSESKELKMWAVFCGVFYFVSQELIYKYKNRKK